MSAEKCDVCGGQGDYPIIDMHGFERYYIKCPECWGSGEMYDEEAERAAAELEVTLPPRSTAADISTLDQMQEYVKRVWSHLP